MWKNKLSQMIPKISNEMGLSYRYTNHCIKATVGTGVNCAGVDNLTIMSVTGHRIMKLLESYVPGQSDAQRCALSLTLQGVATPSIANCNESKGFSCQLVNGSTFLSKNSLSDMNIFPNATISSWIKRVLRHEIWDASVTSLFNHLTEETEFQFEHESSHSGDKLSSITFTQGVPEPVLEQEPVLESEPVEEPEQALEPEPVVEQERDLESEPVEEPEQALEPEPVVDQERGLEPEPVVEQEQALEPEPVVELEQALEPDLEPVVEPEQSLEPEPVVEPEQALESEPVVEPEQALESEPVVEPEQALEPDLEPVVEQEQAIEPEPVVEPKSPLKTAKFKEMPSGEHIDKLAQARVEETTKQQNNWGLRFLRGFFKRAWLSWILRVLIFLCVLANHVYSDSANCTITMKGKIQGSDLFMYPEQSGCTLDGVTRWEGGTENKILTSNGGRTPNTDERFVPVDLNGTFGLRIKNFTAEDYNCVYLYWLKFEKIEVKPPNLGIQLSKETINISCNVAANKVRINYSVMELFFELVIKVILLVNNQTRELNGTFLKQNDGTFTMEYLLKMDVCNGTLEVFYNSPEFPGIEGTLNKSGITAEECLGSKDSGSGDHTTAVVLGLVGSLIVAVVFLLCYFYREKKVCWKQASPAEPYGNDSALHFLPQQPQEKSTV